MSWDLFSVMPLRIWGPEFRAEATNFSFGLLSMLRYISWYFFLWWYDCFKNVFRIYYIIPSKTSISHLKIYITFYSYDLLLWSSFMSFNHESCFGRTMKKKFHQFFNVTGISSSDVYHNCYCWCCQDKKTGNSIIISYESYVD